MGWNKSCTKRLLELFRTGEVSPELNDPNDLRAVYEKYEWIQTIYPGPKRSRFYGTFRRVAAEYISNSEYVREGTKGMNILIFIYIFINMNSPYIIIFFAFQSTKSLQERQYRIFTVNLRK